LREFINAVARRVDNLARELLRALSAITSPVESTFAADHLLKMLNTHPAVKDAGIVEIFHVFLPSGLFAVVSLNTEATTTARQLEESCLVHWGDKRRVTFQVHIVENVLKRFDGTIDKSELMREYNRKYFIPFPA
jgi:hypothetical protein